MAMGFMVANVGRKCVSRASGGNKVKAGFCILKYLCYFCGCNAEKYGDKQGIRI